MNTDQGGWTAIFSGKNGSNNVFDHFDGSYNGVCPEPASLCLRRAPASIDPSNTEIAASCGNAMVKFRIADPQDRIYKYFVLGGEAGFVPLPTITVIGSVSVTPSAFPDTVWTGQGGGPLGFIFGKGLIAGGAQTVFAQSFNGNTAYDGCNGVPDQSTFVRVLYR